MKVAVIIPCHNYARYLGECLDSVLSQTRVPDEIIVVDDASTDNCRQIAESRKNVKYIRVNEHNEMRARLLGMQAVSGEILCFLDADDRLPENYLATGIQQFREQTGIVYSDIANFGNNTVYRRLSYDPSRIHHTNTLHAGCLVRRAALEATMALEQDVSGQSAEDWTTWLRVIEAGWQVAKNPTPYHYRQHGESQTATATDQRKARKGYYQSTLKSSERITLFVPLSGRWRCMGKFQAWLENLTFPKSKISLILMDTSGSERFGQAVRRWISTSGYSDVRYCQFDLLLDAGLADFNRRIEVNRRKVQLAASRIYTKMKQMIDTEYVLIVEDDVIPPVTVCEDLLSCLSHTVASVSGAYKSRYHNAYLAWSLDGRHLRGGRGIEQVGGTGFGCLLLRKSILDKSTITHIGPTRDYDPNFFDWLSRYDGGRFQSLINWDCECEHLEDERKQIASDLQSVHEVFAYGSPLIGAGGLVCEGQTI